MLRVFQSVRGLSDDSVTRLDKNEELASYNTNNNTMLCNLNFNFHVVQLQQHHVVPSSV